MCFINNLFLFDGNRVECWMPIEWLMVSIFVSRANILCFLYVPVLYIHLKMIRMFGSLLSLFVWDGATIRVSNESNHFIYFFFFLREESLDFRTIFSFFFIEFVVLVFKNDYRWLLLIIITSNHAILFTVVLHVLHALENQP